MKTRSRWRLVPSACSISQTADNTTGRQTRVDDIIEADLADSTRKPQCCAAEMMIRVRASGLSTRSDPNPTYTGGGPIPTTEFHDCTIV